MISSIFGMVWEGLKVATGWMTGYNAKKAMEARRLNDEKAKKDKFNESLKNNNIDDIRRDLSP